MQEKMIEMLDRIEFVGGCDIDDLEAIALADFTNYDDETLDRMENILFKTLHTHGKRISEAEGWPDSLQPHKEGYELEDALFWTHYTGVAGRYWGNYLAIVERGCYAEMQKITDEMIKPDEEETIIIE